MKFERERRIKTLDLGIGRGGWYLNSTGSTTAGVELHLPSLPWLRERYFVKGVVADAFNLPFKKGSFSEINVFYPHDHVLYGLSNADIGLWAELERVLKPDGFVDIVFDVYPNNTRVIGVGIIPNVLDAIEDAAHTASFSTYTVEATNDYLKLLGTRFAKMASGRKDERENYRSYRMIAAKIPGKC